MRGSYRELGPIDPIELAHAPDDHLREPLQDLTRRLGNAPDSWTDEDREWVLAIFDKRAATWDKRANDEYRRPLRDALVRGGVERGGRVADLGSATGLHNETLLRHFDEIVSVDLSLEMLRHTASIETARCAADAAHLPFSASSLDALVIVNCFIYAPEYRRVLRQNGAVIFVSTRDAATPIYLPPELLLCAFAATDPGAYACGAKVGIGRWTVVKWQ